MPISGMENWGSEGKNCLGMMGRSGTHTKDPTSPSLLASLGWSSASGQGHLATCCSRQLLPTKRGHSL